MKFLTKITKTKEYSASKAKEIGGKGPLGRPAGGLARIMDQELAEKSKSQCIESRPNHHSSLLIAQTTTTGQKSKLLIIGVYMPSGN